MSGALRVNGSQCADGNAVRLLSETGLDFADRHSEDHFGDGVEVRLGPLEMVSAVPVRKRFAGPERHRRGRCFKLIKRAKRLGAGLGGGPSL